MNDNIEVHGNVGVYLQDGNIISFQLGDITPEYFFDGPDQPQQAMPSAFFAPRDHQWLSIQGYQVLARGWNNSLCDEVISEIKNNRLLPRLYSKMIKMLYGHGPAIYIQTIEDNKLRRSWQDLPEVKEGLDSWPQR